jgi:hypothetical protein
MRFGIIRKVADALSVNRKPSAPEETGALIADLKALETSLAARLVDMSDDRRTLNHQHCHSYPSHQKCRVES